MKVVQRVCFVLAVSLIVLPANCQAAQYWWGGDGVSYGGAGTWDTTSSRWNASWPTPGTWLAWPNGGSDEAVFTNTAGTVTLSGTININKITFLTNSWTFNSGTLNFGSSDATLSNTDDASVTINSPLSGSGTLTLKTGGNTWERGYALYGNNSAFTGKIVIYKTAGSYFYLFVTNDFNLGAVSSSFIPDALTVSNNCAVRNLAGNTLTISATRGITIQAGGGSFISSSGTINMNSIISGESSSGTLQLSPFGGTINLNAVNTYANGTDFYGGGNLVIGVDNAVPHGAGKGNVQFRCWSGKGLLDLNGHTLMINGLTQQGATYDAISGINNAAAGTASLILGDNNATASFIGIITNSGGALSLTKIGTGTQTLSGTNTYTGATTISGGTLVFDRSAVTNGTFAVLALGGGTMQLYGAGPGTNSSLIFGNLTINAGECGLTVTNRGGSSTLVAGDTWTRNAGSTLQIITAPGAGSSVLSSNPALSNGLIGGYAFVSDGAGLGFSTVSGGNIVRYTGATELDTTVAAGDLNASVNYVVTNTITLTGPAATQRVNSIEITNSFSTGTKTLLVGSGGILVKGSGWFGINGKITSATGELVVNAAGSGNPDLYADVVDNGTQKVNLVKTGKDLLRINAGNTYTGDTIINGGSLGRLSALLYGSGKGNLVVNYGGTATLENGDAGVNGLAQSNGNSGGTVTRGNWGATPGYLTVGYADASASFSGVIGDAGASYRLALIKTGAGTQTLSGINTYLGETTISNGAIAVGSNKALGTNLVTLAGGGLAAASGSWIVSNTVNLAHDAVIDTAGNSLTIAGAVTNSGSLTKIGSGMLVLSGTNTYTGWTVVSNGILRLGSTNALSTNSAVYICAGASVDLAFSGTNTVTVLQANGVAKPAGIYGAAELPGVLSGGGYLCVLSVPYELLCNQADVTLHVAGGRTNITYSVLGFDTNLASTANILCQVSNLTAFTYVNTNALASGDRRFYRITESVGSGVSTSGWIYMVSRKQLDPGVWCKFALGIDYGPSNKLDSTIGSQLAQGLTGNNDKNSADLFYSIEPTGNWAMCYLDGVGTWRDYPSTNPTNTSVLPWQSFWIKRRGGGTTYPVYYGYCNTNASPVTFRSNDWHMITWPLPWDRKESDGPQQGWGFAAAGAQTGGSWLNSDLITVGDGNALRFYYLHTSGRWCAVGQATPASNLNLHVGEAYYYMHRGTGITWTATAP